MSDSDELRFYPEGRGRLHIEAYAGNLRSDADNYEDVGINGRAKELRLKAADIETFLADYDALKAREFPEIRACVEREITALVIEDQRARDEMRYDERYMNKHFQTAEYASHRAATLRAELQRLGGA